MSSQVLEVKRLMIVDFKYWETMIPQHIKYAMFLNRVRITHEDSTRWIDETMLLTWCNENAVGLCYLDNVKTNYAMTMMFENADDMLAFKLKFDQLAY